MIKFFKKLLIVFITLLLPIFFFSIISQSPALANEEVNIHFFSSQYCPHCRQAEIFLEELKAQQPSLIIHKYEVTHSQNSQLLTSVASCLSISGQGVPFIVIHNQAIIGFSTSTTPGEIYQLLDITLEENDLVAELIRDKNLTVNIDEMTVETREQSTELEKQIPPEDNELNLPIFGQVNPQELSLPILTIMIGLLDGFNPCAMWVLIFLISLLMGMQHRPRMWLLGSVFIFASGFVYFLFMSAWLNFFLFIGLVDWIRIAIAALAIFVAIHYLRDFVKNKDGACQVQLATNKQQIFSRLKEIVYRKNLIWSLIGIILLAFTINLLELVCSAGLPAVYTKVLSMSNLATWQYYLYLCFYILIFMLDDVAVFTIAMISMKKITLNAKYARYSHLIGGIVMMIIGILMFFKPEWIMFG